MTKPKLRLTDPDEMESPEALARMVRALRPLVDRANTVDERAAPNDNPATTAIAAALGLTPEQAEEGRAFGFL